MEVASWWIEGDVGPRGERRHDVVILGEGRIDEGNRVRVEWAVDRCWNSPAGLLRARRVPFRVPPWAVGRYRGRNIDHKSQKEPGCGPFAPSRVHESLLDLCRASSQLWRLTTPMPTLSMAGLCPTLLLRTDGILWVCSQQPEGNEIAHWRQGPLRARGTAVGAAGRLWIAMSLNVCQIQL